MPLVSAKDELTGLELPPGQGDHAALRWAQSHEDGHTPWMVHAYLHAHPEAAETLLKITQAHAQRCLSSSRDENAPAGRPGLE